MSEDEDTVSQTGVQVNSLDISLGLKLSPPKYSKVVSFREDKNTKNVGDLYQKEEKINEVKDYKTEKDTFVREFEVKNTDRTIERTVEKVIIREVPVIHEVPVIREVEKIVTIEVPVYIP